MSNTQLELIISEKTTKCLIKKLDDIYIQKTSTMRLLCKLKLLDLKMTESGDPTDFFNEFEKLVNK